MRDKSKIIRFIDSEYRELFRIPDGGSIKITFAPDDIRGHAVRECKYLGEYHFEIRGNAADVYHICQFAEFMEKIGARYEPVVQLKNAKLTPFKPGEEKFYTYNREEGDFCIGHITGDYGSSGVHARIEWYKHKMRAEEDLSDTSIEFQTELCSVIYELRRDLLKDNDSMLSYCETHPEAKLAVGDAYTRYGFELETESRRYFINCFFGKHTQDARFNIYAYDKSAVDIHER